MNEKERQECKLKLARLHNSILYAILSIDNARSCIIHFLLSAQANTDKRVEREREREKESGNVSRGRHQICNKFPRT